MFRTKAKQPECTDHLMLFTGITIGCFCFAQRMVNIYQSLDFVCHVSTILFSALMQKGRSEGYPRMKRARQFKKKICFVVTK